MGTDGVDTSAIGRRGVSPRPPEARDRGFPIRDPSGAWSAVSTFLRVESLAKSEALLLIVRATRGSPCAEACRIIDLLPSAKRQVIQ